MRIDRDPLRKPPGGRVPASPGRSVYATTSVKMRRKAASTLFSEYGHARKDVINRRPGGNSIRGLTFDRWRAKNRRETGEKKEKRKKKIGTGPWAVASEGRPQSWRETRLIYVRKWPINRRVIDARARCQRGNAFLRPDPEPEFRGRAPRGPRPTKTTTASRVELEDDDAVAGIRELHVVQRSNRNMLDSKQAYTVPRNSFFETEERGERGPVSPSRTSRLCIACYEEWKNDAFPASWNYPLFYGRRRPPPFRSRNHLRIFFMTRFSRIIRASCIYLLVFRRGETARYGYPQTED